MRRGLAQRLRLDPSSLRAQLWVLFGLIVAVLCIVLVVDELAHARTLSTLRQLQHDALTRMRNDQALSDLYRIDVAETAVRVRNGQLAWDAGAQRVGDAVARADGHWSALRELPRSDEQRGLFTQFAQSRARADAAAASLHRILQRRDADALAQFMQAELFLAIDPVVAPGSQLSRIAELQADALVETEIAHARRVRLMRLGFATLALLSIVLLGRRVLRDATRGVGSLVYIAQRMQRREYRARPPFMPRGELGTVMDAFVEMRDEVVAYEAKLADELERNERVRFELEHVVQLQQSLLDAAQVAILVIDDRGRWSGFNPFAERLLGWRAADLLGREVPRGADAPTHGVPRLLPPREVQAMVAELQAEGDDVPGDWRALYVLAERRRGPRETQMLHRDGRLVPVELSLAAIRDDDGERHGIVAVAVDLTERKQLERQLRESEAQARGANRAKSAFLAAMSHEIRTPLIGITGMIDVLAHTRLDADQRRSLNIMRQSSKSLLQVIGDVLDFSKIEAGRLDLILEPASLASIVQSTVDAYSGAAASRRLSLRCTIDPRLAPAQRVDALKIRQILGNLVSNAIKFTERGGIEVALDVERDASGVQAVRFGVRDTGIGLTDEQQRRLFQEFSQADDTTTRRYGGTGLGLAISRRLAELMGGTLVLDSVEGAGTTATLRLAVETVDSALAPDAHVEAPDELAPARAAPPVEQARRAGRLVLLVDDHPVNRLVIGRQLELAGYAHEAVADGEQALARWQGGGYGLVLSDVHMPRMDGYALARAIRAAEVAQRRPHTPVIALTASALHDEGERCLEAGMDDHLVKPVPTAVLARTVERWIGAPVSPEPVVDPEAEFTPPRAPALAAVQTAAGTTAAPPDDGRAQAVKSGGPADADRPLPLDAATLGELGPDAGDVLADYIDSLGADLAALQASVAAGDLARVIHEAHRMRGAARIVGALPLANAVGAIELQARAGSAAGLDTAVEALQACIADVRAAADAWAAPR